MHGKESESEEVHAMSDVQNNAEQFDLSAFWRALQDLEDGSIQPERREKLMALLRDSQEARLAYFEYFQQTAIFEIEGAKMDEAGRLPVLNATGPSRRLFRRSVVVAAVITALLAIVATLIVIKQPEPGVLQAKVAAETRWVIDEVPQGSGDQRFEVIEGSTVRVDSGIVELVMESGTILVMQGPATVAFPDLRKPVLKEGWLWVDSEDDDEDFAVETVGYLIRDVGTRFGVRTSRQGALEIHLIEGRVEVTDQRESEVVAELEPSEKGVSVEKYGKLSEIELANDPFPSLPKLLAAKGNLKTTILSQSPIGYWRFEEVMSGRLRNEMSEHVSAGHGVETGLGEDGLGSEGYFQGLFGVSRGIYFPGTQDKSVVFGLGGPDGISTREGAVSFWIRGGEQSQASQALWLGGQSNQSGFEPTKTMLYTSLSGGGRVRFGVKIGGEECELNSRDRILDKKWHHIVASWGTSSIDLFVDGKLVDRHRPSSPLFEESLTGRFVRFGKPSSDLRSGGMAPFKGWADEVATWNRPLTHAEVLHQYESARGSSRR